MRVKYGRVNRTGYRINKVIGIFKEFAERLSFIVVNAREEPVVQRALQKGNRSNPALQI
jgi:hypothetical protein